MDEFVSTFTYRLDAKGRVSVPAAFRTVLLRDGLESIYCFPALDLAAVDAGGTALRDRIRSTLAAFPPFSVEHEQLSTFLLGESETVKFDAEGRMVITDRIRAHAGIDGEVTFVGQGYKFQIWEPERFLAYREEAKSRVRDLRKLLASGHRPAGATGGSAE